MTLSQRLEQASILIAPGVADTMGAALAEHYGFEAVFLSGSAVSLTHLARPDIGLVSLAELASITQRISERVDIPVMVDADSGFGNAYQVHRCVRTLELAGASGIQIEDQLHDKSPAQIQQRPLISDAEMHVKLRAALDARRSSATLISARSDAVFSEGPERAIERAIGYAECGVDIVFVEGLQLAQHRRQLIKEIAGRAAVLFNIGWPHAEPPPSVQVLESEGFAIALSPKTLVQAAAKAMQEALTALANDTGLKQSSDFTVPNTVAEAISAEAYLDAIDRWSSKQ